MLATPTQQSYFVQLSGLFESEFSSLRIVGGEVAEKQMIEKIDSKERRERKGEASPFSPRLVLLYGIDS